MICSLICHEIQWGSRQLHKVSFSAASETKPRAGIMLNERRSICSQSITLSISHWRMRMQLIGGNTTGFLHQRPQAVPTLFNICSEIGRIISATHFREDLSVGSTMTNWYVGYLHIHHAASESEGEVRRSWLSVCTGFVITILSIPLEWNSSQAPRFHVPLLALLLTVCRVRSGFKWNPYRF